MEALVSSEESEESELESCDATGVFVLPSDETEDEEVCPNSFPCSGVFCRGGRAGVGTGVEALSILL